ncbi:MAG: urea ABC transporter substrate-binding protein [bacterium]
MARTPANRESTMLKNQTKTLPMVIGLGLLAGVLVFARGYISQAKPIRVGILHSLTGPMAISEKAMADAEILAIEEINNSGGLLGRPVEYVVADGKSDWPTFAREAERLIEQEHVDVMIGCWTSASRKTVLPVVESKNHLLIYPMAYEGLEQSPNIIYTGSAPNQQISPAISWAHRELKANRFYLVGSDYIWPHSVNAIAAEIVQSVGATVAGTSYLYFGTSQVDHVIADILEKKPDVIISTVVGDTNKAFYNELYKAGITADKIPVISFSIAETELSVLLREIPPQSIVGHYSAWNYFQTINRDANRKFVKAFQAKYGSDRSMNDTVCASYNSVYFWAQAVREAESTSLEAVRNTIRHQSLDAPEGIVSIDFDTNHTWRPSYIAQARADGQFDIRWTSDNPLRPVPFPNTRTRPEWNRFLNDLFVKWNRTWSNPRDDRSHTSPGLLKTSDLTEKQPRPGSTAASPPVPPAVAKPAKEKEKAENKAATPRENSQP